MQGNRASKACSHRRASTSRSPVTRHIYERNNAATGTGRLSLPSYTTGGGGGDIQSLGTCGVNDAYAIGWSDTSGTGTCGTAPIPTSRSQIYHFLKVTVSGSVGHRDADRFHGRTFDVKTYAFKPLPDTYIDTPAVEGYRTGATFQFHAGASGTSFTCRLDSGNAQSCTSPRTYYQPLAGSAHILGVRDGEQGQRPAPRDPHVDGRLHAAQHAGQLHRGRDFTFSVALNWSAATDNTGVTGYDIVRDGTTLSRSRPARATSTTRSSAPRRPVRRASRCCAAICP